MGEPVDGLPPFGDHVGRGSLTLVSRTTLLQPLFRIVYVQTRLVGVAVARLAAGYREASQLERLLILPSWLVLRAAFLAGHTLSLALHSAAPS